MEASGHVDGRYLGRHCTKNPSNQKMLFLGRLRHRQRDRGTVTTRAALRSNSWLRHTLTLVFQ